MQQLKFAIITERLGHEELSGSTTLIATSALERGHKVFECEKHEVSYQNGQVIANMLSYPSRKKSVKNLGKDFDVILFRPNPPVDMEYLSTLYLLRTIEDKVLIINKPSSVINLPEKIFPFYLSKYSPETLVTKDTELAAKFLAKHKEIIVKPLYDYGGHGIIKVKTSEKNILLKRLKESSEPVLLQKFLKNIAKGNKRVLFIDGKVAGAVVRIPKKGAFLANYHQGSTTTKTILNKREQEICKALSKQLKQNDIMIAGVDIIDGYLTEVNITSPAGFGSMLSVYKQKPHDLLVRKIENICN